MLIYHRFAYLAAIPTKSQSGGNLPVCPISDFSHVSIRATPTGAGSVLQQLVARGGNTQPPLFRAGMTSSVFLPPQFKFDDEVPEVLNTGLHLLEWH